MTVICLEGPSAVGKSSTARELERVTGLTWMKEVNALFSHPQSESPHWYDERQIERFQRAQAQAPAVLDGDPFQTLWYGWTYPEEFPDWAASLDFIRGEVAAGQLKFPDVYIILQATEAQLRERQANDLTRRRRNFERHLRLMHSLPLYFQQLAGLRPGQVVFMETHSVSAQVQGVQKVLDACPSCLSAGDDLHVFDTLRRSLEAHPLAVFLD